MGLNKEQLEQHCKNILQQREIMDRIVILCEGNPLPIGS